MLDLHRELEQEYSALRDAGISSIEQHRPDLSHAQSQHMHSRNKQLNLALRLVRLFPKDDLFWTLPYTSQCEAFVRECRKLKPVLDFFDV